MWRGFWRDNGRFFTGVGKISVDMNRREGDLMGMNNLIDRRINFTERMFGEMEWGWVMGMEWNGMGGKIFYFFFFRNGTSPDISNSKKIINLKYVNSGSGTKNPEFI